VQQSEEADRVARSEERRSRSMRIRDPALKKEEGRTYCTKNPKKILAVQKEDGTGSYRKNCLRS